MSHSLTLLKSNAEVQARIASLAEEISRDYQAIRNEPEQQPLLVLCTLRGAVFFAADLKQIISKYGLLSYRLQQLEAGHMAENLSLMLSMLGYNCVPIGGFFEDDLNRYLGIDVNSQTVLYFYAVGMGE